MVLIDLGLIVSVLLFATGSILITYFLLRMPKGALRKKIVYQDGVSVPGALLIARSIPLIGRPDYIIAEQGEFRPIEVKTGKTPRYPFESHIAQLMAYCYLIEEIYGKTPSGGYIRYPKKEYKVAYTQEARLAVTKFVDEIMLAKRSGVEPQCNHPWHNK